MRSSASRIPHPASRKVRDAGCGLRNRTKLPFSASIVLGWPNGGQVVTIAIDPSASITWNESWNIEISSITFTLHDNFIFIMMFKYSHFVRLSDVSIYGNGYYGCSSIISEKSVLEFINSIFIGLNGFVGAALTMFASKITFRGDIIFANNTAASGGSIYLIDSTLIFNGTSLFLWKPRRAISFDSATRNPHPAPCGMRDAGCGAPHPASRIPHPAKLTFI